MFLITHETTRRAYACLLERYKRADALYTKISAKDDALVCSKNASSGYAMQDTEYEIGIVLYECCTQCRI